jgi:predicted RNA-binding protein associated with RNAse of E/G family
VTAFAPGSSIVRRDVFAGQVWTACPARVVADDGAELTFACWPGVEGLAPVPWIRWITGQDGAGRDACMTALAERRWSLGPWAWRWTNVVRMVAADRWYCVSALHEAESGKPLCWYVDFTRPPVRAGHGVDSFDLLLDLVVGPDGAYQLKDEDEFTHACRAGVITEAERGAVLAARDEVIDLVERRAGPFADDLGVWRPDPAWPRPELPPDIESV